MIGDHLIGDKVDLISGGKTGPKWRYIKWSSFTFLPLHPHTHAHTNIHTSWQSDRNTRAAVRRGRRQQEAQLSLTNRATHWHNMHRIRKCFNN